MENVRDSMRDSRKKAILDVLEQVYMEGYMCGCHRDMAECLGGFADDILDEIKQIDEEIRNEL